MKCRVEDQEIQFLNHLATPGKLHTKTSHLKRRSDKVLMVLCGRASKCLSVFSES
jgi:hypothetical protein